MTSDPGPVFQNFLTVGSGSEKNRILPESTPALRIRGHFWCLCHITLICWFIGSWFKDGVKLVRSEDLLIRVDQTEHVLMMKSLSVDESAEVTFVAEGCQSIANLFVKGTGFVAWNHLFATH